MTRRGSEGRRSGAQVRTIHLTLCALPLLWIVAWQSAPPLSLVVQIDPPVAVQNGTLGLTFVVRNGGDELLEGVLVEIGIPEQTVLASTEASSDHWKVSAPARGQGGTVRYQSKNPIPPGQEVQVSLQVTVLQEPGGTVVLDKYTATAQGLETPVSGPPVTVRVQVTPTPEPPTPPPSPTMTTVPPSTTPPAAATDTATPTQPAATPSAVPTRTAAPSPTTAPTATPSPTITVVVAELPPTPTPNLTSEEERLGTATVLVFVGLLVAVIASSVTWLVRSKNR